MTRLTFLFVVALFFMSTATQAKTISKIAAVVNDEIISTYQLDQELNRAFAGKTDKNQLSATQIDNLRISLLDKLIEEKLVSQRTEELDLSVTDDELNNAIKDVQAKNNLTDDQFEQALSAQGMSMSDYRERIKKEILRYKLLSREVNYKVLVTSGEVRDYFRDHIDEYKVEPKVGVSRISFPIPEAASEQEIAELQQQVAETREQLQSGAEFASVLAGLDNANGGDMGKMTEKDLAAPLQAAIEGLNEGDVSEITELNGQLHLFLITYRNPGDITLFDRVKDEIEDKLRQEKTEARFQEWQKELRADAVIDKRI